MTAPREQRIGDESMRTSIRLSRFENDDEEDYALSAMGISDGFNPSNSTSSQNRASTGALRRDSTGRRTPPPRPSSTTKPRRLDSFSLRHDGSTLSSRVATAPAPLNNQTLIRDSSVSTDMPLPVAESPYQGPVGPSHPYHMYPQATRPTRTASVATVSTFQPSENSYAGPSVPTHPYGMYPQDTTAGAETSVPAAAIPVGFPGRRDEYQRRLGPDGEEAGDIIGPMGHTEQLPPYTQYPMESLGKPLHGTHIPLGAGGIGLATRNPEFESREDLGYPNSRQSTRSLTSNTSDPQLNMAALGESEKPTEKRWKQIARKKVCGIVPVWAIVLVGIVCVFFAIVLGTVLGVLGSRRHPSLRHSSGYQSAAGDQETVYSTATITLDASALTSLPTGIPALPTGTFSLPIFTPYSSQQTCLDNSDLYGAWSCALPISMLEVTISRIDGDPNSLNNNNISITHNPNSLSIWFYGTQPPSITAQQTMNLVRDLESTQLGPAWFFQVPYNKVVVVPESTFSLSKRDQGQGFRDFVRKGIAQPGDKPWFCYWNATVLEAFIYVNNTSNGASSGAIPSSSAIVSTGAALKRSQLYPTETSTAYIPSPTFSFSEPNFPPPYPKIIKIEERRIPNSPKPYCAQMVIQPDGSALPNLDSDGSPVIINLNETEPAYQLPSKRSEHGHLESEVAELNERQSNQQCTCVWLTS